MRLTVGALRAAIEQLPDDAQMFVEVVGFDLPVNGAIQSRQISWDVPPGDTEVADSDLVTGLELWAGPDDDDDPEWVALVRNKIRRHYNVPEGTKP